MAICIILKVNLKNNFHFEEISNNFNIANRYSLSIIYQNYRKAFPVVFLRDPDEEIKKIVFNAYIGNETPRFRDDRGYHNFVHARINQMVKCNFMNNSMTIAEKDHAIGGLGESKDFL